MEKTVYFDNAATTFPKPVPVIEAVDEVIRSYCGNPGRSSHHIALKAAEKVYDTRERIAGLFGGREENVVFSLNATTAINLAVKTVLHRGDHVLISDIEHNSVLRPIRALAEKGLITYDIYRTFSSPEAQIPEIGGKLKPKTALVCAPLCCNICSFSPPFRSIGAFCRKNGILFMADASQSAGTLPTDMKKDGIDILCAPGHKGLYGIPGCAFTLFGERFDGEIVPDTFIEGGNGIRSAEPIMPEFLPERLEAGTLPLPAIVSLGKGIEYLQGFPTGFVKNKETEICRRIKNGIKDIPGVRFYGPDGSILLFSIKGAGSEEIAAMLDEHGICVRSGFHCAPLAHKKFATSADGAVRVSPGIFNTRTEAEYFVSVMRKAFLR